jgi:hypothetical protein
MIYALRAAKIEDSSFLKKRSKKLLHIASGILVQPGARV